MNFKKAKKYFQLCLALLDVPHRDFCSNLYVLVRNIVLSYFHGPQTSFNQLTQSCCRTRERQLSKINVTSITVYYVLPFSSLFSALKRIKGDQEINPNMACLQPKLPTKYLNYEYRFLCNNRSHTKIFKMKSYRYIN